MKPELTIALIDSLVSDYLQRPEIISKFKGDKGRNGKDAVFDISLHTEEVKGFISTCLNTYVFSESQVEALKGPKGDSGESFDLEKSKEDIENFVRELFSGLRLTSRQKEELRGKDGKDGVDGKDGRDGKGGLDGRDGKDGKNGKNFIYEEHRDEIEKCIQENSLTFDKLTNEQKEILRGPKGEDGNDGLDGENFVYSKYEKEIRDEIVKAVSSISETLKLKFSDLSDSEKEEIRGHKGAKGEKGESFHFEDHRSEIESILANTVDNSRENLKLKFSELTSTEKEELKLKFSDLTDSDRKEIKGPRGQRGKKGDVGEKGDKGDRGERGSMGPRGVPGIQGIKGVDGKDGEDGIDGKDGKDAPEVVKASVNQDKEYVEFVFELDNGKKLKTNEVKLPKGDSVFYYPQAIGGGGNGGGGGGEGTKFYSGQGQPPANLGGVGDYYIDKQNTYLYGPKGGSGWGEPLDIGPGDKGTTIYSGDVEPSKEVGVDGDFYLDLQLKKLYGPKVGDDWGTPIELNPPVKDPTVIDLTTFDPTLNEGDFVVLEGPTLVKTNIGNGLYKTIGVVSSKSMGVMSVKTMLGATPPLFNDLEVGEQYYLDKNVSGGITKVKPTEEEGIVAPVGVALSSTTLLLRYETPYAIPKTVPYPVELNIGDPNEDGSWRFVRNSEGGLDTEVRLGGVWEPRNGLGKL